MSNIEKRILKRFPQNKMAKIESIESDSSQVSLDLFIQPELEWFIGHFDEQAVLAGVVQTHWATEIGKTVFDIQNSFSKIENLKFKSVIIPNIKLTLTVKHNPEKNMLSFTYKTDQTTFSQGRIYFESSKS